MGSAVTFFKGRSARHHPTADDGYEIAHHGNNHDCSGGEGVKHFEALLVH